VARELPVIPDLSKEKEQLMRKVIFKIELTLDGFIEGPKGEMDWVRANITEENWEHVFDMLSTVDTVLMSRVIYQGFKEYWPPVAANPSSPKYEKNFSNWLNATPKIVFSKTLEKVDWMNSRLVKSDVGKEIARLKQQSGENFIIWGGADFPQTLMNLGLIDEYWINVHPVIIGNGKPLFIDNKNRINFKLLNSQTFKSGTVGLCYQPIR
jgi:dihydrofolate reductase